MVRAEVFRHRRMAPMAYRLSLIRRSLSTPISTYPCCRRIPRLCKATHQRPRSHVRNFRTDTLIESGPEDYSHPRGHLVLGKRIRSERGPPPSGRALTPVALAAGQPNAWRRSGVLRPRGLRSFDDGRAGIGRPTVQCAAARIRAGAICRSERHGRPRLIKVGIATAVSLGGNRACRK